MEKSRLVEKDPQLKRDDLIVITGAGGFIAGNLAKYYADKGLTRIRAVDKKPLYEWYLRVPGVENICLDVSNEDNCHRVCEGADGRNSDNTFVKKALKCEPNTKLDKGPAKTYAWLRDQYNERKSGKRVGIG